MNNPRRKELAKIYDIIQDAYSRLETVKDEEQEYMDNMPEGLQTSERYERAEEVVDSLEEALDSLDEILNTIDEAQY